MIIISITVIIIIIIIIFIIITSLLFNRFAHSAGPGREPQRVEAAGCEVDGLMHRSKGQVRSAI
ncbi:hypothetical protein N9L19_01055 [bacterium]|nr:hypothetical protein [bacterium]